MDRPRWTVSVDAGGTFTDAVARSDDGRVLVAKVASTPDDPSRGLANAVDALAVQGMPVGDVGLLCHGTTVATNAILTGDLSTVALLATRGFRDVMGYRQSSRPTVYSLTPERPDDLVERRARIEVTERLTSTGEVLVPLEDTEVERVVAAVAALNVDAVAVSLLFSYLDDSHERRLGDALRRALPGVPVTLSSAVAREFREYPRTATTVINAALRPVIGGYMQRAAKAAAESGVTAPFLVMQSNGGSVPAARAEENAHRLVLSGPAGGVAGLVANASRHGLGNVISLDMGGTSTDVCLVRDGRMPFTTTQALRDHVLLAPAVDIHTIGAGGGSIAWTDQTGRLRVGPQSARAVPGPASYLRGGTQPTITDAHVVLGTLGTGQLAGELVLDRAAAITAVDQIGAALGTNTEEAAEAILAIGLAHMVRAVRKVSVERGLDPREFTLVPFGGAGPLHAGLLLRHLGLRSVLVPSRPGLFSADGLLVAGLRLDDAQTVLVKFDDGAVETIGEWFRDAAHRITGEIEADASSGADVAVAASADCRYLGQGFELNVTLDGWEDDALQRIPALFHSAHEELYGHANRGEPVEVVTLRIAAVGGNRRPETPDELESDLDAERAVVIRRVVRIPGFEAREVPVYERSLLQFGDTFDGPAIVAQMDSTTVLCGGQRAEVVAGGDLLITEGPRQ
ncbi:methylhydantoinase [Mycobacterium antarcticum]|uniref:hydantoinase/oxoprolinase family protein n=1 Tax=Mycolicibacterium sp. TUM20985 TaxID=3023370 RepID=UPI00257420F3|nr:hydantoinase/oxoprolinase family protein [Mycolicibacterium sp. TUM20985]BDX29510.1 methylhydantoinase [Mycolicibacterium sp. TUM20985]